MLRFSNNPKPRNYFSRREQWRLLVLVMSLGLIIVLIGQTRKEQNWRWLERLANQPESPASATKDKAAESIKPEATAAPPLPRDGYFPGVTAEELETIRDKAPFVPGEREVWFHLFAVLEKTDASAIRKASVGSTTRLQLTEQSEEFRGRLVTVRGTIRRAFWVTAPANDRGIGGYYQTWLQPDDSPDSPMMVYCLHLPDGFPTGMETAERVEATGFYFKRRLYNAQSGLELAPVVLARTLDGWKETKK
jgi:hypothetical protein